MGAYGSPEMLDFLKYNRRQEKRVCKKCGAESTGKYCPNCGALLTKGSARAPKQAIIYEFSVLAGSALLALIFTSATVPYMFSFFAFGAVLFALGFVINTILLATRRKSVNASLAAKHKMVISLCSALACVIAAFVYTALST